MKYNSSNKPLVCMQTNSTCYKGTSKMTVKGVLWHSTGANNPWLKRYVQPSNNADDKTEMIELLGKNQYGNDWNHISMQAGLNAWIGKLADGTVATVQTMPWNYKPWGCGSGSKGSCNNGFVQFEICEDALTDATYFNKVYKEACELTAYICEVYNLDPNGTVNMNGVKVPVILCHQDSYKLGLGSNHSDIYHWFKKHGKTMDDVRKDVSVLMGIVNTSSSSTSTSESVLYRVRKSWDDSKSQIGAYKSLDNAKSACDKAGDGYHVFDNNGEAVYPVASKANTKIDTIKEVQSWANTNYKSGLTVDGIYGNVTKKALIKILQKEINQTYSKNIVVDGIFGEQTKSACPSLKSGIKNDVVGVLQAFLICNGYADIYLSKKYGSATTSAVKSYQSKKGLTVDGIAGKVTFSKLCG